MTARKARLDIEDDADPDRNTRLVPVLPLHDLCLFPGASLTVPLDEAASTTAVEIATRTGGTLLAVARREGAVGRRDVHSIGTLALVRPCDESSPMEKHVELDGIARGRVEQIFGSDVLVAEVAVLSEGDEGEEWGPAVEALARYLHSHQELRSFLERQSRSSAPMSWVSLACQHLPIAASARQKLLEANAAERCTKISRGLDALLRKEQNA